MCGGGWEPAAFPLAEAGECDMAWGWTTMLRAWKVASGADLGESRCTRSNCERGTGGKADERVGYKSAEKLAICHLYLRRRLDLEGVLDPVDHEVLRPVQRAAACCQCRNEPLPTPCGDKPLTSREKRDPNRGTCYRWSRYPMNGIQVQVPM